ncbi:MAG: hypothetical protein ACM3X6_08385 [Patescibacteria group bacterium]
MNGGIGPAATGSVLTGQSPISRVLSQIVKWLIFSVAIALAPLVCRLIVSGFWGQYLTVTELCCGGELFLISSTMATTAVGRLVATDKKLGTLKNVAAGCTLFLLLVSSFSFAFITANAGARPLIAVNVASSSYYVFATTVVSSGSCVIMAEV